PADAVAEGTVEIERPWAFIVAGSELDTLHDAVGIVERGERNGRAELAEVEHVLDDPVVGVEAERQAGQRLDRDAGIEIVGPLGLYRIVLGHLGRRSRAGQDGDRTGVHYLDERRRCEVARITDMRRKRRAGLPHYVDARAELVLLCGAVDGVETQA